MPNPRSWYHSLNISKVAVERVKEYSELEREPPEFVDPRPPPSWPTTGRVVCKDLVIRYSVRRCRHNLFDGSGG